MKRLERLAWALTPKRWPVRWRLAAVSATLTLIILVVFALVVGRLTSNRLQGDFNEELRNTATRLSFEVHAQVSPVTGAVQCGLVSPDPREMATITGTAAVRVVSAGGVICAAPGTPHLGPPHSSALVDRGSLRIATVPSHNVNGLYIQYAKDTDSLNATTNRLWLFLGLGVLGGTALATLGGIA